MWVFCVVQRRLDFWASTDVRITHSLVFRVVHLVFSLTVWIAPDWLRCEYTDHLSLDTNSSAGRTNSPLYTFEPENVSGEEEKKGGENKFKGRLADIPSICHLEPHTIKGPCEWSLLSEEREPLAAADFLQRSINWARPKRAVHVPLTSERRAAHCTLRQRSSGFSWLPFSVLIRCIHVLTRQKMQSRQMLPFWGDIMVLIIPLVIQQCTLKRHYRRGLRGPRQSPQDIYRSALCTFNADMVPCFTSASFKCCQIISHYRNLLHYASTLHSLCVPAVMLLKWH